MNSEIFITPTTSEGTSGSRLAVKDIFDTAGIKTTYGSAVFADHVPNVSAEAVVLLESAGYVNVGKTNLHEFAYGVTSQNDHYGTVPNPRAPGRTAGGSSGGSAAAIAAGLADVALGTDTGGSIRIPAACCGIVGFKPTYGLVSVQGVFPLAPSYDHAGPMARDVHGCVELMKHLAPTVRVSTVALEDLRIGLAWTEGTDEAVGTKVAEVGAYANAQTVNLPLPEGTMPHFLSEIADVHRELFEHNAPLYGEAIRVKLERCLNVKRRDAEAAHLRRAAYRADMQEATASFDLIITPTLQHAPPPADVSEIECRDSLVRCTYPFNVLGWPALALPVGASQSAPVPISIQLIGRPGDDALVLAAGLALEQALLEDAL